MTNTITLGSPPAPKQPRSVEEMKPGQIARVVQSTGKELFIMKDDEDGVMILGSGTKHRLVAWRLLGEIDRVLPPGESITITVGE